MLYEGRSADFIVRHRHPFLWSTLLLFVLANALLISVYADQQHSQALINKLGTSCNLFEAFRRELLILL
jgi:hypothetical protein